MGDRFTATAALAKLLSGELSAVDLLNGCLKQISQREAVVGAWESLNLEGALRWAKTYDANRTTVKPGLLQGIPIGIKDTFATIDLPTRWGTPIHHDQVFTYDAAVVEQLRSAGANILGKTVTSEYAIACPGKTRNPCNLKHTPGASSSGSAAAVAADMVPIAIGTQMVGSTLRPAAYCGILGFKPSFGVISRYGLMPSSRALDQVGIFAHSIADIRLVLHVLAAVDQRDPDCHSILIPVPETPSQLGENSPRLALVLTPHSFQLDAEAKAALLRSANVLTNAGAIVTEIQLSSEFAIYLDCIETISTVDMATHHGGDYDRHANQMSAKLRQGIERGRMISAIDYGKAIQTTKNYRAKLACILSEFDAILTPVTTGAAPQGFENTGSSVFCALWTLCGLPAISIPAGYAANGLPLGIQLVGRWLDDEQLLTIADWAILCLSDAFI